MSIQGCSPKRVFHSLALKCNPDTRGLCHERVSSCDEDIQVNQPGSLGFRVYSELIPADLPMLRNFRQEYLDRLSLLGEEYLDTVQSSPGSPDGMPLGVAGQMEDSSPSRSSFGAFPRDPSIQIIPTLVPKVCKYYLHWAFWIPRLCLFRRVILQQWPRWSVLRPYRTPIYTLL